LGGTGLLALLGALQLVALTGVTPGAYCSFSSLIISAAVLALGLGGTGRLALLCACAAHRPDGRDARRRLQLQPAHHLDCSFSSLNISAAVLALYLGGTGRLALLGTRAALRPTGVTLAAACSFSSLIISAARARRSRPPAASARSSSWPLLSPSALPGASAAHHPAGSGRDARSQLIALTGATLVSYCASASSLPFYASSSSSPQQQHRISANAQWGGVRRWRGTLCLPLRMGVTASPHFRPRGPWFSFVN
jgi:hypothetical protein